MLDKEISSQKRIFKDIKKNLEESSNLKKKQTSLVDKCIFLSTSQQIEGQRLEDATNKDSNVTVKLSQIIHNSWDNLK